MLLYIVLYVVYNYLYIIHILHPPTPTPFGGGECRAIFLEGLHVRDRGQNWNFG